MEKCLKLEELEDSKKGGDLSIKVGGDLDSVELGGLSKLLNSIIFLIFHEAY